MSHLPSPRTLSVLCIEGHLNRNINRLTKQIIQSSQNSTSVSGDRALFCLLIGWVASVQRLNGANINSVDDREPLLELVGGEMKPRFSLRGFWLG